MDSVRIYTRGWCDVTVALASEAGRLQLAVGGVTDAELYPAPRVTPFLYLHGEARQPVGML